MLLRVRYPQRVIRATMGHGQDGRCHPDNFDRDGARRRQPYPQDRWHRRVFLGGATMALAGGLAGCALPGQPAPAAASSALVAHGKNGNIVLLDLATKTRKALTDVTGGGVARDPTWSPDGKRLVYAYTPPLPATRGPGGLLPLPVTDLYIMNADGSDAKILITHDAPGVGYESPVWAPDGQSLYVTYTALIVESNIVRDQMLEVARVPVSGGPRQTLAQDGVFPGISPDGKRMVFVALRESGMVLAIAAADGKQAQQLLPSGKLDGIASPRFSPDGAQVVFTAISPAGTVPTATPARTSGAAPSVVLAHGLPMDVFVINADGTNLRRLTQLGEDSPAACWSPDGKKIAIVGGGGSYLMNADGSGFVNIDQTGGHGSIDWRRP